MQLRRSLELMGIDTNLVLAFECVHDVFCGAADLWVEQLGLYLRIDVIGYLEAVVLVIAGSVLHGFGEIIWVIGSYKGRRRKIQNRKV